MIQTRNGFEVRRGRRGAALMSALVIVMTLAGLTGALLSVGTASRLEVVGARDSARALYLAEAGMNDAIAKLAASRENPKLVVPESIGSVDDPVELRTGSYWVDIDVAGNVATVTSYGTAGRAERAVEAVLAVPTGGIYSNAVFAGNLSGDPNYAMGFSGNGTQGDEINGDIYSAGDVAITGDASVNGDISAGGTISGDTGSEGVVQATPDLDAMDYENIADYDVLAEFKADAYYTWDQAGGDAWQLPETSAAHIFRANPSDRSSDWSATEKQDFFLEDPYETVNSDSSQDGSNPYLITLSGSGEPGPQGTDVVYYIDGNMWVHNKRSFSMKFVTRNGDPVRVTFVVKGNVYFSDNIFYNNDETDGVAFIAMTDDDVKDSGNIYFGDPTFGTLEHMSAFMYAENNFYDNNLDAKGSARVRVKGNMTAGNQVDIQRDYGDQHSKLTVDFDDRISSGALKMPGLPSQGEEAADYVLLSWREATIQP